MALFLALDNFAVATVNVRLPIDNRQSGMYLIPLYFKTSTSGKRNLSSKFQLAILVRRLGRYDFSGQSYNRVDESQYDDLPVWCKPTLVVIDKLTRIPKLRIATHLINPLRAHPSVLVAPSLSSYEFSAKDFDWRSATTIGKGPVAGGIIKIRARGSLAEMTGRKDRTVVLKLTRTATFSKSLVNNKRELYYGLWLSSFYDTGMSGADKLVRTFGWTIVGNYLAFVLEYIDGPTLDDVFGEVTSVEVLRDLNARKREMETEIGVPRTMPDDGRSPAASTSIANATPPLIVGGLDTIKRQVSETKSILSRPHVSIYAPIFYILDVLRAVSFMHSKGIVHKDIKDDNVVVDFRTGKATLIDLGLCALMNTYSSPPLEQLAPRDLTEDKGVLFIKDGYVDVYACALLIRAYTKIPAVAISAKNDRVVDNVRAISDRYTTVRKEDTASATINSLIADYTKALRSIPAELYSWTLLPPVLGLLADDQRSPTRSSNLVNSVVDALFMSDSVASPPNSH